jgi:hypothetical protein
VRVDSGEGVLVAGGSSDELLQLRKKEMDLMRQQIWKKLEESHPGRCSSWGWKNGGDSAQFGEERRSGMVGSSRGGKRSDGASAFYARRLLVLHGEKKGGGVGVWQRVHVVGGRRVELQRRGPRRSATAGCGRGGRLSGSASRGRKATRVGQLFGPSPMNNNIFE